MPVTEHPSIEVFKQVYGTFTTGEMDRLAELIAKDVVWHVPGTNLISGEYTSREATRIQRVAGSDGAVAVESKGAVMILVIGGRSKIGVALIGELLRRNQWVRVLVRAGEPTAGPSAASERPSSSAPTLPATATSSIPGSPM